MARLALFALTALALLVSVSAHGLSLEVTGPDEVDNISDLQIKTTLKNTGPSALTLVNDPGSVLSTQPTNTFSISHEEGANPAFIGIHVESSLELAAKNGAVTKLGPGESIDVTHSLGGAYNFADSGPGTYEISPSTRFHVVSETGDIQSVHASLEDSHVVTISGPGRLAVPHSEQPRGPVVKGGTLMKRAVFPTCSASQQSQLKLAIPAALKLAQDSVSYLNSHTTSTPRFTTWFGSFTKLRHTTILDHFNKITTPGSFTSWTYNCTCDGGTEAAYVISNQYGTINLCAGFFREPVTGSESMAGLLVHEATHFARTARTNDFRYGKPDCMDLARRNPIQATRNADSHRYFAENSPPLQ